MTLAEMYEAMKGGKLVPPKDIPANATAKEIETLLGGQQAFQKQVDDMKSFMSEEVNKLAAAGPQSLQVIEIRGRKLAIPRQSGSGRTTAALFACFYASMNPGVDTVLRTIGVKGHFMDDAGEITLEPFVGEEEIIVHAPAPAQESGPSKRNILIEEAAKPEPTKFVAVYAMDGKLNYIGMVSEWSVRKHADGTPIHKVALLEGATIEVLEDRVKPIKDYAELAKLSAQLHK